MMWMEEHCIYYIVSTLFGSLQLSQEAPDHTTKKKPKEPGFWDWMWGVGPEGVEEGEEIVVHSPPTNRTSWLDSLSSDEKQKLYSAIRYNENETVEHSEQVGNCIKYVFMVLLY